MLAYVVTIYDLYEVFETHQILKQRQNECNI